MALKTPISIVAIESLSALGMGREKVWDTYLSHRHGIEERAFPGGNSWVAPIPVAYSDSLEAVKSSQSHYRKLDETVIFALAASRLAVHSARWNKNEHFGINIGSSRGATGIFESHHRQFMQEGNTPPWTSPATTLGNISSWVAHDLQSSGPEISHSITCSTALHALLNGVAWIQGGMANRFLVGGSEAPLTPFTVAQMKALKIYAKVGGAFPCRALDLEKDENTMVLGEGAAMACLQAVDSTDSLALIDGVGYATEILESSVSISTEADCFQRSMQMALGDLHASEVDAVVMHAPGTIKGDESEFRAVEQVFGPDIPLLTSNKWMTGHTLGASGMLSVELAVLMLQHQVFIPLPYSGDKPMAKSLNRILVNAVGFGGNAVSILLKRPD